MAGCQLPREITAVKSNAFPDVLPGRDCPLDCSGELAQESVRAGREVAGGQGVDYTEALALLLKVS